MADADTTTETTDTETTTDTTDTDTTSESKPDDSAAMAAALAKANAEAKKYRLEAKKHADEIDKIKKQGMSDQDKAIADARAEARAEALREAGTTIVESVIRTRFTTDADADAFVDGVNLARFVGEDGSVDRAALTAWLDKVAPATKPAPKVHSGPRGKSPDAKPSMSDALRALRHG